MTRLRTTTALIAGVTCLVALTSTTRLVAATTTLIMSGLNSPRGLTLGPDGGIYVTEAGTGGAGPCIENRCYGRTGAISRLLNGVQQRIVTGLSSHALPSGDQAIGPNDMAFQGSQMLVLMGLATNPSVRPSFGTGGYMFGKLLQIATDGQITEAADVAAYETDVNPAGGLIDTNPFGLLLLPNLRIVADAGANALLTVAPSGLVNTMSVFPSRPARTTDSVPTSLAVGPDGAYYVGELTGTPFAAGSANIYRVVPRQAPQVFLSGFTTVTDLAFGPDGSLYVIEHSKGPAFFATPGDLVKITPDGQRTVLVSNLNRPTSVMVTSDGTVYYTNRGITAGAGEVWKFTP
ncbi:MAG: ScyD/ScyE family protein [Vicinamibacterales bacterium]